MGQGKTDVKDEGVTSPSETGVEDEGVTPPSETGVKPVLIRNMPADLHKVAKLCAVSQGMTLQDWVILAVRRQAGQDAPKIGVTMTK